AALELQQGSTTTIARVAIDSGTPVGIIAMSCQVEMHDVRISGTHATPNAPTATALDISGSRAAIDRIAIDHTHGVGLLLRTAATATISNLTIETTLSDDALSGTGIYAGSDSRLMLSTARIANSYAGAIAIDHAQVMLRNVATA